MENIDNKSGMKFVYTAIGGEKKIFILDQANPKAVIGRNSDCDMQTDCLQVSRYHAVLVWENGHVYVMFPSSGHATNGLNVGGRMLQPNERLEVFAGTQISVGEFLAVAYTVDAEVNLMGEQKPDINEGVVFFWRFGKEEIRALWMNSQNRLAVIGSSLDCELCIPECMEKISPHHAVLVWLSARDRDRVYIDRHPDCSWQETILSSGSIYENKLVNGLHGLFPECAIRIGDFEIFAFYPGHAFKLLGVESNNYHVLHESSETIDKIMAEVHEQIRVQNEIERSRSNMMVGYGPPPVYNGPVGVFSPPPQPAAPTPRPSSTSDKKSFCTACGAAIQKGAPFCSNCGATLKQ